MESYKQEVIRKRRHARVFWVIVFAFATLLYFFFNGYYPNISGSINHFLSQSGSFTLPKEPDLIRAFGIINVKTNPSDASIILKDIPYGQNEKKMVDYGVYTMHISRENYLPESTEFRIDAEKPFFIEHIVLLPIPRYHVLTGALDAYPLDNTRSLIKTKSGVVANLSKTGTGVIVTKQELVPLGGGYFHTNSGTLYWNGKTLVGIDAEVSHFIKTCTAPEFSHGIFLCREAKSFLTLDGTYSTGVLNIRDNLIEKSGSIIYVDDGKITRYPIQTEKVNLDHFAVLKDTLYTLQKGTLTRVDGDGEGLNIPLDSLVYADMTQDDMMFIGYREGKPRLILRNLHDSADRVASLPLPDSVDYSGATLRAVDGNFFISAKKAILFVYRRSNEIRWVVDGEIISLSDTGALYRKDGALWIADWSTPISE